jgi:hypothetical protein
MIMTERHNRVIRMDPYKEREHRRKDSRESIVWSDYNIVNTAKNTGERS